MSMPNKSASIRFQNVFDYERPSQPHHHIVYTVCSSQFFPVVFSAFFSATRSFLRDVPCASGLEAVTPSKFFQKTRPNKNPRCRKAFDFELMRDHMDHTEGLSFFKWWRQVGCSFSQDGFHLIRAISRSVSPQECFGKVLKTNHKRLKPL